MRSLILVLMLAVATGELAAAQSADTVYVGSRHSATASGFLEFLFPTAGFAYAGDWTRGFLPNAARIGALIGFSVTADGPEDDVCQDDGICQAWAVVLVGATVWSIVGAVQTANDHNSAIADLQARLLLEPSPVGGVAVGFRLTP